jgi:outer membrane translocation and assembly module TamA
MTTVAAGGEANYTGTNVGRLSSASINEYRLGGTSSIRGYTYTRRIRNNTSVTISPALGAPYYEWFVTGP